MAKVIVKTHWMQSPNKNYLGHWDLPEKGDLILTIESAKWEEVVNPVYKKGHPLHSEAKRVVRFKEDVKPLICNQGNAQSIVKATGVKFMEDAKGSRIHLFVGVHADRRSRENIDCVRIRKEASRSHDQTVQDIKDLLSKKITSLVESEIASVERVIDNEETLSFDKVLKFLTSK